MVGGRFISRTDNLKLAVPAIVVAVLGLSAGDALIKFSNAEFTLWQLFTLRSMLTVPLLIAVIKWRARPADLWPQRPGWVGLRSMMLALQWIAYYLALPHIDLSVAAATYYTAPLFILVFAAAFGGEHVGRTGWLAVAVGFAGVIVLLRPEGGAFNAYAVLPIVSAILYAGAMVMTRTHAQGENPLVLALSLNAAMLAMGVAMTVGLWLAASPPALAETYGFLLGDWRTTSPATILVMVALAVAMILGSVGAAIAYQKGPSSLIAPFDFFYVLFAAVWGLLVFVEVPDAATLTGMILIVGAGVLATRRKAAGARPTPMPD